MSARMFPAPEPAPGAGLAPEVPPVPLRPTENVRATLALDLDDRLFFARG